MRASSVLLVPSVFVACAAAAPLPSSTAPEQHRATSAQQPHEPPKPSLPPLTELERSLAGELRGRVEALTALGARNVSQPLSYADATDWTAGQLEAMGFAVERQGFVFGDEVVQNLIVHTPGLRLGWERIVVVARMDSLRGSVGADDNASGVAALMSLAQRYFGKRTQRTIDWVWLADAAGRSDDAAGGALAFLKLAKEKSATLRAMVEVHGLGAYTDAAQSQRYSDAIAGPSTTGDFVAWVSYPEHALISDHFGAALVSRLSLPAQRFTGLSDNPPVPHAAQRAFLQQGIPSLLFYDTQALRYADFGTAKDTAERLDYERMARAVVGLHDGILALAGGFGEAPLADPFSKPAEPGPSPTESAKPPVSQPAAAP